MRVHLCGVRGSTPAPGAEFLRYGGHTSCVAISHDDSPVPTLILDAGTGLRRVTPLLGGRPFEGTILLTHLHWDHLHGLPFFRGGDTEGARVTLLIPEQDGGTAAAVLARGISPPHFPIGPDGLRGEWTFGMARPGPLKAEGFTVEAREIPHKGGRTFGYRVSDGHAVLAYLPDHCPTELGPGPDGWGAYHQDALDLSDHADMLINDSFLLAPEVAVVLETDRDTALKRAREYASIYLPLPNYTDNLRRFGFTDDDIEGGGSDRLIEAVIPWGDAATVAERVRAHIDAGADHVCVQVVADFFKFPLAEYRELAPALVAG